MVINSLLGTTDLSYSQRHLDDLIEYDEETREDLDCRTRLCE